MLTTSHLPPLAAIRADAVAAYPGDPLGQALVYTRQLEAYYAEARTLAGANEYVPVGEYVAGLEPSPVDDPECADIGRTANVATDLTRHDLRHAS